MSKATTTTTTTKPTKTALAQAAKVKAATKGKLNRAEKLAEQQARDRAGAQNTAADLALGVPAFSPAERAASDKATAEAAAIAAGDGILCAVCARFVLAADIRIDSADRTVCAKCEAKHQPTDEELEARNRAAEETDSDGTCADRASRVTIGVNADTSRPFVVVNRTKHYLLQANELVRYESRIWLVGMVNDARARLDPLSATSISLPESGRSFQTYGQSVNVAPTSQIERVSLDELTETQTARVERLKTTNVERNAGAKAHTHNNAQDDNQEEDDMAKKVVGQPGVGSGKAAKLAKKPVNGAKPLGTAKAAKVAGVKKEKVAKELKPCGCGCGELAGGYFRMGHDARFKGLMLKVERGEKAPEEVFTKAIVAAYTWVKTAKGGKRATKNYKGEVHDGYDVK